MIAIQKIDEDIKELTILSGRLARESGLPDSCNPYDYNSIIGMWWQYGYDTTKENK